MSNFHPLDFVGRGSGTQLQVDEKLNKVTFNVMQYRLETDINLTRLTGRCN